MSLPIDLPAISIPEIPLPIEIPEIIHPAIVHFAIAIPVVILLLELYNLAARRKTISAFSLFLIIVVAIVMVGAYLTGAVDGKATWDMLSTDAQGDLKAHKLLGIYLVYASLALVILKLLTMAIRKTVVRILFILILGGFIAVTLFQGKEGGELVYKYGANSERVADLNSDAEDSTEELNEAEEKLSELQAKYDELVASTEKASTAKEEVVEEKASNEAEKAKEEAATTEEKAKEETPEAEKATEETPAETPAVVEEDKKEEADSNETAPSSDTNSSN